MHNFILQFYSCQFKKKEIYKYRKKSLCHIFQFLSFVEKTKNQSKPQVQNCIVKKKKTIQQKNKIFLEAFCIIYIEQGKTYRDITKAIKIFSATRNICAL